MNLILPALMIVLDVGRVGYPPLRDNPEPFDPDAAVTEFGKSCTPPNKGPRCPLLRRQIEAVYLSDLLERRAAGDTLDPSFYRAALKAENPLLVVLGLRGLAKQHKLTDADVSRGIEDPRYAVRTTAVRFAQPAVAAGVEKRGDRAESSDGDGWLVGVRDPDPTAADLGAAVYPGSKLRYFATGPHRWFFTTTDSPDKVVAFYTKGGKRTVTAADLKKMGTAKPDMAAIMAEAQSDPQALMRMMQDAATTPRTDWTAQLDGQPGVVDPKYVIVAENKTFGNVVPTAVVMIFKDEVLGATAVVFPRSTQPRIELPHATGPRKK